MTRDDFFNLNAGDMVRPKGAGSQTFIVTGNYGDRVTAVRTADLTNPPEWDLVLKAKLSEPAKS